MRLNSIKLSGFKSFVEPYTRSEASPEAKEANLALAGSLWSNWQSDVARARPKARLAGYIADPVTAVGNGGLAQAALASGIVDKLGSRAEFSARVAKLAGDGVNGKAFAAISLPAFTTAQGTAQNYDATLGNDSPGTWFYNATHADENLATMPR